MKFFKTCMGITENRCIIILAKPLMTLKTTACRNDITMQQLPNPSTLTYLDIQSVASIMSRPQMTRIIDW